jgi:acyl dehydratase
MRTDADGPWFEDVAVGDELPPVVRTPAYMDLVVYAGASRDYFDIHHDRDAARAAGHPDVIVQGSLKAAWVGQVATGWMGRLGRLRRFEIQYRGVDVPGRTVTGRGLVRRTWIDEETDEGRAELELWLENEAGERTVRGSAVVALPRREGPVIPR